MKHPGNIFANLPPHRLENEQVDPILDQRTWRLERIISTGQITPKGQWYDQSEDEWVILLKGDAKIVFENGEERNLQEGDYLFIPAHIRHRVTWTDPNQPCVWLALHSKKSDSESA